MKIEGTSYQVMKGRDGVLWYNFGRGWKTATANNEEYVQQLVDQTRRRNKDVSDLEVFNQLRPLIENGEDQLSQEQIVHQGVLAQDVCLKLMNFFSEFSFEPNYRFINTLAWNVQVSSNAARTYIENYFRMMDSPSTNSVVEKMNSAEFRQICKDMSQINISKRVNKRFRIYFGSQGTGKTTKAVDVCNGNVMVCHSAILPQDLMEDFKFVDGKPTFQPSALQLAMVNGSKVCLDEINLLPFESLRFLQSILDGKEEFEYKGNRIKIKEGFEIIGTMNLVVNGCAYPLPEPLVDRSFEIAEFKLTADQLASAF